MRKRLFQQQQGRCTYCNVLMREAGLIGSPTGRADARDPTLEHVVPRSWGGSDHYSNLTLVCYRCNHQRGDAVLTPAQSLRCGT
jgi:5-methylcytosine-specific restriction endonuclease McrA